MVRMLDRVLEKERDNYAPAPSLYRHTRQDLSWDRNDTLIRSFFVSVQVEDKESPLSSSATLSGPNTT